MGNKAQGPSLTKPEFAGIPYVRGRVLGKGAFGKVYVVQLSVDKTFVRVVKEMHKSEILKRGPKTVAMLVHERELLTRLSGCPFVVRCMAASQDSQRLFMLLDFCSGGELVFHLNNLGHMSEDQVRFFAAELVVALDAMHNEYFIVHRDLKPENVLLDQEGHVSVIDFNIAKQCESDGTVPNPEGKAAGTIPYMAPEILRGKDHSVAVDWWSLGIMLYELRTGQVPFATAGKDKPAFCQYITENLDESLERIRASSTLKELLTGLLRVDAEKRWKAEECKKCAFFADLDWDDVKAGKLVAPITPDSTRVNFKADANMEEAFGLNKVKEMVITEADQLLFEGWNWSRPDQEIPQHLMDKINKVKEKRDASTKSEKSDPQLDASSPKKPRSAKNAACKDAKNTM